MAVTFIASLIMVMIVDVRTSVCYRERRLIKEMVDTVGRRGHEKNHE
jgi:hypothetical protein